MGIEQIKAQVVAKEERIAELEAELARRRETKIKDIEREVSKLRREVRELKAAAVDAVFAPED